MSDINVDVIIAGGGANGLALALSLLTHTQLTIAIVEAQTYPPANAKPHPGFDARVIALAMGSVLRLEQMGMPNLSQKVKGWGEPIKQIHVSDRGHLGQCKLAHQDYQVDALGYVVALADLGQQLRTQVDKLAPQSANQNSRLIWCCPDTIANVEQQTEQVRLELASGKSVSGKLLVVAEGGQSRTRDLLGIPTHQTDYQQTAIVANVISEQPHQGIAYERFTDSGPIALLPMRSQQLDTPISAQQSQYSLVWSVRPEQLATLKTCPDAEFLAQLQQAFGYRAGQLSAVSQRFSYPLYLLESEQDIHHRVVCVGNSAQSLHPIAGQGLNLGLRDVQALANIISAALAKDETTDIGRFALLNRYHQQRQADKESTIGLTDTLVRTFSNNYLPMQVGRNWSLFALQHLNSVKTGFANITMGLAGDKV